MQEQQPLNHLHSSHYQQPTQIIATTYTLRSLYKSLSSFFQRAYINKNPSLPQGNPAAIRSISIFILPRAFAWSYGGITSYEFVSVSSSSSSLASSLTCSVTFLVNVTYSRWNKKMRGRWEVWKSFLCLTMRYTSWKLVKELQKLLHMQERERERERETSH